MLLSSGYLYAEDCLNAKPLESSEVQIYPDSDKNSGMYHIRVPEKYKNLELKLLVLTAADGTKEISMPLAIKSKGSQTGSYFHMSPNWLKVLVTASYGNNLCLSLVSKSNM